MRAKVGLYFVCLPELSTVWLAGLSDFEISFACSCAGVGGGVGGRGGPGREGGGPVGQVTDMFHFITVIGNTDVSRLKG